jgi:hypothetical protein
MSTATKPKRKVGRPSWRRNDEMMAALIRLIQEEVNLRGAKTVEDACEAIYMRQPIRTNKKTLAAEVTLERRHRKAGAAPGDYIVNESIRLDGKTLDRRYYDAVSLCQKLPDLYPRAAAEWANWQRWHEWKAVHDERVAAGLDPATGRPLTGQ